MHLSKSAIAKCPNTIGVRALSIFNKSGECSSPNQKQIHKTPQTDYPQVARLPIPVNIDPNETTRFSPQRNRDISGNEILLHQSLSLKQAQPIDVTIDSSVDPHVASYDCMGSVNLYSVMQSNVPEPFSGGHKFTHLNMPGGQWSQSSKFMASDLQASHYTTLRQQVRADWNKNQGSTILKTISKNSPLIWHYSSAGCFLATNNNHSNLTKSFSSQSGPQQQAKGDVNSEKTAIGENESKEDQSKLTTKDKLKRAVKEYGSTVIVFHVTISLASLGLMYTLVSSGLDVVAILESLNISNATLTSKIGTGASTFVIAYAVHKVFAPVRISITLASTPFIVRFLRNKGILKPPKSTN